MSSRLNSRPMLLDAITNDPERLVRWNALWQRLLQPRPQPSTPAADDARAEANDGR
jgi:hypothetical protein